MKKFFDSDLYSFLLKGLVLIFIIGLISYIGVFGQSATINPSTSLNEIHLDTEYITVILGEGETFIDYLNLVVDSFTLIGEPPGTFIESITGSSATVAQIILGYDGTDFDIDYPSFHVLIKNNVLNLSTEDLATNSITICYALEPVIVNVSIPNDTMNIGMIVTGTITVEDDEGSTFSLEGGSEIGGYPLTSLTRINNTLYSCSFTVVEGGIDYSASENIPVRIRLLNDEIQGNLYSDPIIQEFDLLDANKPAFQYIYTLDEGAHSIGDEFTIWIQTDGANYSFAPTSHVNNIPLTSSTIEISPVGSGRYSCRYIVQEGEDNVNTGELALSIVAIDMAGNMSLPFTDLDPNTLSIDASRPIITRAYIYSTDTLIIIGETFVIRLEADQAGYRNDNANTWINGVYIEPDHLTFSDLRGGLYEYQYTVGEYDGAVSEGNLAINLVLQDAEPYNNFSDPFAELDENNVSILTHIPVGPVITINPSQICYGDSAQVTVFFRGTSPWTFDITDGMITTTRTSDVSPYTYWIYPQVTTHYMVSKVTDAIGDSIINYGNALIKVDPVPDVRIINLLEIYDVTDPPVVLEYIPSGGTFTGPGISDTPWTFDPGIAGISSEDSLHEIVYTYTASLTGCTNADTVIVQIVDSSILFGIDYEKPVACSNDSIFLITAWNTKNYIGNFTIEPEPPPGAFTDSGNNTAVLRPVLFDLDRDLDLTITYTIDDLLAVEFPPRKPLTIEYMEDAKILPLPSDYFCENAEPIELSGYPAGGIFYGNGITGNIADGFWFKPTQSNLDTNTIQYIYTSENGCINSTKTTITVSPTYTQNLFDNAYFEDFEDSLHVWTSIALDSYQNSWTYKEVDSANFPWNASSGIMAWYTDKTLAQNLEKSAVLSPCFNFENFNRPMLSLDINRSLDHNNDGAALQYTTDYGKNWITLGGIDDGGINWYNSDSIWDGPFNLKTGWTGEQEFSEDSKWYKAAYWLDDLTGKRNVQFRIVFSSNGDTTVHSNGFAFDNFTIKQRTRLSVLEYFTNANTPECYDADLAVCNIMKQIPDDVIDIQYHARGSQADMFYLDNPVPANNRGTVYGVTGIPNAYLDGNIRNYGFESDSPNLKDIRMRSLMDPDFQLRIFIYHYGPELRFSIEIEALRVLEPKERTLHSIVLQRIVDDSEYVGTNGIYKFRNVARKMLPDAGGYYLGSKAWIKGETEYSEFTYGSAFFPINGESIKVVAFLQDEETKEILQVSDFSYEPHVCFPYQKSFSDYGGFICETLTGIVETNSKVLLYPNPAREIVNVSFEGITKEEMKFTLYDLAGKIMISDIIEPWQQHYKRPLGDLEQGLYIVEIRTNNDKQIIYRGKLFHY